MANLHYSNKHGLIVAFFLLSLIISPSCVQGRRLRVLMSENHGVVNQKEQSMNLVKEVPSGGEKHEVVDQKEQSRNLVKEVPSSGEKHEVVDQKEQSKNLAKEVPSGVEKHEVVDQKEQSMNLVKEVPSGEKQLPNPSELVGMDYSPMSNKPPVHN